jgi:carbonic anhydrase
MSKILDEVLGANRAHVATFGDKGKLAMPPARRFSILTCMDARLDPAKFAGLAEGDAHVTRTSLETAALDEKGWRDQGRGPGTTEAEFIDWLTIRDQTASVVADVRRIRTHPLVPNTIPIYGYVYEVTTGRLVEVPAATQLGRAS